MSAPAGRVAIRLRCEGGRVRAAVAPPAPLSLDRLFVGKPAGEVARLVPLIWNLCGAAQALAARSALGLPPDAALTAQARAEALREHALKLCVVWPSLTGGEAAPGAAALAGRALADPAAEAALRRAVFAPLAGPPGGWGALRDWLAAGRTPPARAIAAALRLPAGVGVTAQEPFDPARPVDWPAATQRGRAVDNGLAPLHADVALMREAEALRGRGPVWRMLARLIDLDRLLAAPPSMAPGPGAARAARGVMLVRASVADGLVAAFERLSPTDFALAPGGALADALDSLPAAPPAELRAMAALVIETLDPCAPVSLEVADA